MHSLMPDRMSISQYKKGSACSNSQQSSLQNRASYQELLVLHVARTDKFVCTAKLPLIQNIEVAKSVM